MIME